MKAEGAGGVLDRIKRMNRIGEAEGAWGFWKIKRADAGGASARRGVEIARSQLDDRRILRELLRGVLSELGLGFGSLLLLKFDGELGDVLVVAGLGFLRHLDVGGVDRGDGDGGGGGEDFLER